MILSTASVSESLGLEHCTLVHLSHAFSEHTEDPIEKVKCCTVGNGTLWLNQLTDKYRLKLDECFSLFDTFSVAVLLFCHE